MNKTYYIETMGCQMNKLDSELVITQLEQAGYAKTNDKQTAGVIVFNTCSVRQHAEDKVISKVGQLRSRFLKDRDFVLAIIGCMAQRMGQELLDDHAQVAVVCGPSQIHQLADMVEKASRNLGNKKMAKADRSVALNTLEQAPELEQLDTSRHYVDTEKPFMAFVRVMRGCNNFCNYCIVPYVRGREQYRPLTNIVEESRKLVEQGVKEITLLGQAVNQWIIEEGGRRQNLADVLEAVHEIDGLLRLRFVTSYPRNFDDNVLQAMADLPKVCPYLHMPAQSGSDRMLKAMNRHYTSGEYIDFVQKARQIVPDLSIAGDFIVGYCGEDEADQQATLALVEKVRYKNCFVFKYSPRPGTKADQKHADDVSPEIKQRRLEEILTLQKQVSDQDNRELVGETLDVLVEGLSKKPHLDKDTKTPPPVETPQLVGRTGGDQIVVFNAPKQHIGQIIPIKIRKTSALTLFGELPV
ncbi:MAG: tRNA (N6-isopentenyl adenosine(37)-C2)-methylthiotransferase MiaB [Desulfobulbaceae bacterium]|nr:tRNA (N6-isopentenyl adenosine(37)-C2)-methylthiotransferase MiaB [Desulfobulbaceae bacterium]